MSLFCTVSAALPGFFIVDAVELTLMIFEPGAKTS